MDPSTLRRAACQVTRRALIYSWTFSEAVFGCRCASAERHPPRDDLRRIGTKGGRWLLGVSTERSGERVARGVYVLGCGGVSYRLRICTWRGQPPGPTDGVFKTSFVVGVEPQKRDLACLLECLGS
jgi:hypothetical protein